jgi:hypothetical protein
MSDTREVAHYDEDSASRMPATRQSDNLLAQVIAAAGNPAIDAEKMKALAELVNSQQDRDLKAEFNRDLNAAMMEMPVVTKAGRIEIVKDGRLIQSTPFAKLEDIDRVCRPILQRHNLAIRFDIGSRDGGGVTCTPIITHTNGWVHTGMAIPAPIESSGSKNNVQGVGSTISYLRRYAYCTALNIMTEGVDDDGNLGAGKVVSLTHERENLVLAEAEAAHAAGTYLDYFGRLGPKDRGWLMSSGKHVEFGGQAALPSRSDPPAQRTVERTDTPTPSEQPREPAETKPPRLTARQWVDKFKEDLAMCATKDAADEFMDEARDSLDKLKGTNERLWNEAQDAYRTRLQAIEEGRLV